MRESICFSSVFTGDITALNDLWLVGDAFLQNNYYIFPGIRDKARSSRQPIPYIFEYYNVKCFYMATDVLITDVLVKLVNSLILALNDTLKLPRIILVVPDTDIIDFVNFSASGTRFVFSAAITWIVTQMD